MSDYQLLSNSVNLINQLTIHSVRFLHGLGYFSTRPNHRTLFCGLIMQLM